MPFNHPILCCPLLFLLLVFPSTRVFSNESALCIRWPKYWNISFNISPSNEYSGLISFRIDWFDLLAVQGTLKRLLQHHISKASILWRSAFYIVQLSHPQMTTSKAIVLTIWTFVGRVRSLLFNALSKFVIAFLPRSKQPHGQYSPWNFPGQNTGVGSLSLFQGIFPTQGSNPGLPHCRWILYQLNQKGSPRLLELVAYPFSSRSS